jgi:serine phosphatase RsbU (regulator of sigma subunit)
VILPMSGRGRITGLLSLFRGPGSPPFSDEDVDTAADLAGRAGLALDNARLYADQVRLAGDLQRSLLTAPPEPDHVQIVVRYEPAAETAQVGGDWYDAFLQPTGSTVLVIGDVVGHDSAATAAMGQLRGLLRGITYSSGAGPASALRGLDAAMQGLQVGTFATAVVARLEQTDDEHERGVSRVRWSNAGHPPPMVITAEGGVAVLSDVTADLLLGIDPDTERHESEVSLDPGATLLLYTDGLVERRGQSLDEGLARLRSTLEELGPRPLDELCDELLTRLLPAASEDDVALVAVRLHPQDRQRPAEAGPNRVPPDVPDPSA